MSQAVKSEDNLLEERIQKIRRNNERIQRRHLEVEADKQHAAKLNALVQLSPPHDDDDDDDDDEPRFSHPRLQKKADREDKATDEHLNYSTRHQAREHNRPGPSSQPYTGSRNRSLPQDDGPPPDPVYNFLADRDRDPVTNSRSEQYQRGSNRGGRGGRGQYRERTAPSEMRGKFSRGRGRVIDGPHQHAYEMWKSERNQIDQERINRQKTAGGEWKREWDKEKVTGDVIEDRPPNTGQGRYYQDIPYRRDKLPLESFIVKDGGHLSATHQIERSKDSKEHTRKKKIQENVTSFVPQDTRPPARSPKAIRNERIVKDLGTSLQVSLKNENALTSPVQRVKVTPKNVAGTGRVGPRQQARMSYSSQSEDEAIQRTNAERKVLSRRQGRKSEEYHTSKSRTAQATVPPQAKEIILDGLEAKERDASKPPLPPTPDLKVGNGMDRPKRQRIKPQRQKGGSATNKIFVSKSDSKESSDDTKEISESGDDGWEDVTTTSGTESMSEDANQSHGDNSYDVTTESKVTKLSSSDKDTKNVNHVVEQFAVSMDVNSNTGIGTVSEIVKNAENFQSQSIEVPKEEQTIEAHKDGRNIEGKTTQVTHEGKITEALKEAPKEGKTIQETQEGKKNETSQEEKSAEVSQEGKTTEALKESKTFEAPKEGNTIQIPQEGKITETIKEENMEELPKESKSIEAAQEGKTIEAPKEGKTIEVPQEGNTIEESEDAQSH